MHQPMSKEFTVAFVQTCMAHGLSKEATAELLQHRSIILAAEASPAFADGYLSAGNASHPRVRPGYMSKEAGNWMRAGGALLDAGKAIGGAIGSNLGTAGAAAWKHKKPLGIAAGAVASGFAGHKLLSDPYQTDGTPYLPPGGYNPIDEQKDLKADYDKHARGIYSLNKSVGGEGGAARRRVLEESVRSNSPDSAMARAELQQINAQRSGAKKTRDGFLQRLNSQGEDTASKLEAITQRQQTLRERQQSPFWRGLQRMKFTNPDKHYNEALSELQPRAAGLNRENTLINKQRKAIMGGYTQSAPDLPSSAQLQRDFFPTAQ